MSLFKRMTFDVTQGDAVVSSVRTSELPSVLRQWRDPGCCLALWQRSLAPDLVRRLDRLSVEDLPVARFLTTPEDAGRKIAASLLASGLPDTSLMTALGQDMAHLVTVFAAAAKSPSVDVRIEAVEGDACRRFHTDVSAARLVTTYIGPGTVWVPPDWADEALRLQEAFTGTLWEMPRFSVGMFGGSEAPGGGLVHRSPRLTGTGRFRLFFCLNQPQALSRAPH